MENAPLPQQPDFGAIAHGYSVLSNEFSLFGNLPAVGGATRFQEQVLEQLRLLREEVRGLGTRIDAQEKNSVVREKNSLARHHNGFIHDARSSLSPLSSVRTGELIEDFPENLDEMDRLPIGQVDRLLRELGQSVQGREDARRTRLVTTTGVRNRAVEEPSRDRVMQRRQR